MTRDHKRAAPSIVRPAAIVILLALLLISLPVGADDPTPDCDDLTQAFYDKCTRLREEAARLNCEERNGYSGCAVDVVSCCDNTWHTAFRDCEAPGYVDCAQ